MTYLLVVVVVVIVVAVVVIFVELIRRRGCLNSGLSLWFRLLCFLSTRCFYILVSHEHIFSHLMFMDLLKSDVKQK